MDKKAENNEFDVRTLNVGKNTLTYNTQPEGEQGNIYTIIKNSDRKYAEDFEVIKGELIYSSQNEKELRLAQEIGININPYLIKDGELLSSNTNLMLMDEATGTLVIPESVTSIGEGTFANVEGLRKIVIPSSVKEIKKNAFNGNRTLEEVVFETKENEGLNLIGQGAFDSCTNLTTIHIPDTVIEIQMEAFRNCANLTDIILSNNISTIYTSTFSSCKKLEKIVIPESVITIKSEAFAGCIGLKQLTISQNLKDMAMSSFNGDINIEKIEVAPENPNFKYENGMLLDKAGDNIIFLTKTAILENTVTIPNTVKILPANTLNGYTQITKVIIPASVNSINGKFFNPQIEEIQIDEDNPTFIVSNKCIFNKAKTDLYACYSKDSDITIEEGVVTIREYAFYMCNNVQTLNLPDTLTTLRAYSLFANSKLQNIKIGKSLQNIITPLFIGCDSLQKIEIDAENPNYIAENCVIYRKDKTKLIVMADMNATEFEIPNGVKEIGRYAFYSKGNLTKVTTPETLVIIRNNAFRICEKLEKIELQSNIETIEEEVFSRCTNLKEIVINKEKGSITGSPWGCIYGERAIKWLK